MSKPQNLSNGVALEGYDPVSYFQNGPPRKGDPSLAVTHDGATYHFADEGAMHAFQADPTKYTPEYGGYCATAMSEGKIFEVDPTNYKVDNDRLFLFYKGEAGDTLPDWNADEANRRANADKHWSEDSYRAAE